ncbi:MAG: acyl-CoA thioesterase [Thermodesulfobacteriota bacterium]
MTRKRHTTYYRVIYGDCDSMAIVYYANYLRLFEIGRTELLRDLGLTYREVEEKGFFLPATESYLKYLGPACYDDLLTIETTTAFIRRASSRFDYRILREHETLVRGYTVHACVDADNRIIRFPDFLLKRMKGDEQ